MIQTAMFLSLAIAGLGSVLGQSTSEWTQLEANKRTVQGYLSLVADEKFDQWDKFFADTVLFNGNKMVPLLLNDILGYYRAAFPDLEFRIADQIAEDDRVATWGFFHGTHLGEFQGIAATGEELKWFGVGVDRLEDGRVVEMWHEMDTWGMVDRLKRLSESE